LKAWSGNNSTIAGRGRWAKSSKSSALSKDENRRRKMTIENTTIQATTTTAKKRGWAGKLLRIALVTGLILVVGLFTAHVVWKRSGSGKWQLEIDKDGVQVYSIKLPGSTLKQFRAVGRVKTSLQHVVAVFTDSSLQHCNDWMHDCLTSSVIEPWNAADHYWLALYRAELPWPLSPREFVVKLQFSQDPESKTLFIDVTDVPELLPQDKCCVRVRIHNRWRWTPLKNGEVEVEVVENFDARIPYILHNAQAKSLWGIMSSLPALMDGKQYPAQDPDEKYDFVQEPATETAAAESCELNTAGCQPLRHAAK
jgi:hypothetical protein